MTESVAAAAAHPQAEFFSAFDRDAQNLFDAVALGAELAHRAVHERETVRAQEGARAARFRAGALGSVDAFEQMVGDRAPIDAVAAQLAAVVIGERARVLAQRLDDFAIANRRPAVTHPAQQLVDELELVERGPLRVRAPPRGIRLEPHREGFGEILAGMRLRVPLAEVLHVATAAGPRTIRVRIRQRRRTEHFTPALAPAQTVGRVERVA